VTNQESAIFTEQGLEKTANSLQRKCYAEVEEEGDKRCRPARSEHQGNGVKGKVGWNSECVRKVEKVKRRTTETLRLHKKPEEGGSGEKKTVLKREREGG